MQSAIEIRQTNPANLTNLHPVSNWVIPNLTAASDYLSEQELTRSIREFLFMMHKDRQTYWIGAAVPDGTSDFSKAQIFFHPTVKNGPNVHAREEDYPSFTGGWSGSIQRYVAMQGGQLAGARQVPLIVPFMTMASYSGTAPAYMFATQPIETLNAIISAVREGATGQSGSVALAQIGVSSFSSGIKGMRLFINTFGSIRIIVETTDFDGPFIIGSPQIITVSPGATGRVFSQKAPPRPTPGWITLAPWRFKHIARYNRNVHSQIGWMTFFLAAKTSVIK